MEMSPLSPYNKLRGIMTEQSESFKENYATLKQVAETMRTQQEMDIDALIPLVDKATAAYKVCKELKL